MLFSFNGETRYSSSSFFFKFGYFRDHFYMKHKFNVELMNVFKLKIYMFSFI